MPGWYLESLGWEHSKKGGLYLPATGTHGVLHEQPKVAGAVVKLPQCTAAAQGRETVRRLWKHPREDVCAVSQAETPSDLGMALLIRCSLLHVFR